MLSQNTEQPSDEQDPHWQLSEEVDLPYSQEFASSPPFFRLMERIRALGLCLKQLAQVREEVIRSGHHALDRYGQIAPVPSVRIRLYIRDSQENAQGKPVLRAGEENSEPEVQATTPTAQQPGQLKPGSGWGYFLIERSFDTLEMEPALQGLLIELFFYQEGT